MNVKISWITSFGKHIQYIEMLLCCFVSTSSNKISVSLTASCCHLQKVKKVKETSEFWRAVKLSDVLLCILLWRDLLEEHVLRSFLSFMWMVIPKNIFTTRKKRKKKESAIKFNVFHMSSFGQLLLADNLFDVSKLGRVPLFTILSGLPVLK